MKRVTVIILVLSMLLLCFAGCGGGETSSTEASGDENDKSSESSSEEASVTITPTANLSMYTLGSSGMKVALPSEPMEIPDTGSGSMFMSMTGEMDTYAVLVLTGDALGSDIEDYDLDEMTDAELSNYLFYAGINSDVGGIKSTKLGKYDAVEWNLGDEDEEGIYSAMIVRIAFIDGMMYEALYMGMSEEYDQADIDYFFASFELS